MGKKLPPDEIRLKALGITERIPPGQRGGVLWFRAREEVFQLFNEMSVEERARIVELGIQAARKEAEHGNL